MKTCKKERQSCFTLQIIPKHSRRLRTCGLADTGRVRPIDVKIDTETKHFLTIPVRQPSTHLHRHYQLSGVR